jgi:uncharacterized protein
MKKVVLLLLGLFLVVKPVLATDLPTPTGFVNDFAGILTAAQKTDLEQNLQNFQNQTGNQIALAIVKDLGGDSIENVAVKTFEQWKIGQKGKDNGVLLLVAVNDHKLRIEVGYGLEPVLTDAKAGDIIRDVITPKFKQNDYYGGLKDGVLAIENVVSGQEPVAPAKQKSSDWAVTLIGFFLFFGFWALAAILKKVTKLLADIPGFWAGPIGGIFAGSLIGLITGSLAGLILLALLFGGIGLILDFFASQIYKGLSNKNGFWGRTTGFWGSSGGGGSGFSGFGGGSSGGGGASGGW